MGLLLQEVNCSGKPKKFANIAAGREIISRFFIFK